MFDKDNLKIQKMRMNREFSSDSKNCDVKTRLDNELEKLKELLGLDSRLRVVWTPSSMSRLSGEVKGDTIYIYEVEPSKALESLRHEVIDYLITSKIVEPLVGLVNALIKAREVEIYREKEKLIDVLSRILC